jgi:hypothetical protein
MRQDVTTEPQRHGEEKAIQKKSIESLLSDSVAPGKIFGLRVNPQ